MTKPSSHLPLVGLVALPLLYVLSIGPCAMVCHPSRMAGPFGLPRRVRTFYAPLIWTADHCPPVGRALEAYAELWWQPDA